MARETRGLLAAWAMLMVLLVVTVAAALLPVGSLKPWVNIGVALLKASIIWWVFMHLKQASNFLRVAALGAVAWVLLLGGMLVLEAAAPR